MPTKVQLKDWCRFYFNFSQVDHSAGSPEREVEAKIKYLKDSINNEREKILMLKSRYTSKLDEKNEMEKILRSCISDYKETLWEIKSEMKRIEGSSQSNEQESRLKMTVKDILDKEKKLTLLYDKLFHVRPLQKDVERLTDYKL